MSEKPEGITLGEGQSWNKNHSYVQTESKLCDREALLAAFANLALGEGASCQGCGRATLRHLSALGR